MSVIIYAYCYNVLGGLFSVRNYLLSRTNTIQMVLNNNQIAHQSKQRVFKKSEVNNAINSATFHSNLRRKKQMSAEIFVSILPAKHNEQ